MNHYLLYNTSCLGDVSSFQAAFKNPSASPKDTTEAAFIKHFNAKTVVFVVKFDNFTTFNIVSYNFHPFYSFESRIMHLTSYRLVIRTSYKSPAPVQTQIESPIPGQGKACKS